MSCFIDTCILRVFFKAVAPIAILGMSVVHSASAQIDASTVGIQSDVNSDAEYVDAKLMRFPDVSASQIVFSYSSDLWLVNKVGGLATRLTTQPGEESSPKFSPDGKYVAFTAPYADGNEDVYVLSVYGGVPRRVTHHPSFDRVIDWHPSGDSVLFSSDRQSERARYNQLYTVSAEGGMPNRLPIPYGEMASFSPVGDQVAFSYLKDFQNQPDFNREAWKRYSGGRSPDIWSLDLAENTTKKLTRSAAPDSSPMWSNRGLYYLSERDGERSNLWVIEPGIGAHTQLTNYVEDDVTRPSIGPSDIVFEHAGGLSLYELESGITRDVSVQINADTLQLARTHIDASMTITHADLSADAELAVFETRGDLILLNLSNQTTKLVSPESASAQRFPSLSCDAQLLAYMSDESGEYQLMIRNLETGDVRAMSRFTDGFRFKPFWSPDNSKIVFIDSEQRIHIVDVASGRDDTIDRTIWRDYYGLENFRPSWSPDSKLLAYSVGRKNRNHVVKIYSVATRTVEQLTSGYYNDRSPVFGDQGNFLYLLSDRALNPVFGDIDTTWTYANSTVVTMAPLRSGVPNPMDDAGDLPGAKSQVEFDLEGFESRISALPMEAGRYSNLTRVPGGVTYVHHARAGSSSRARTLARFDLDARSEVEVVTGDIEVQAIGDGKALLRKGDEFHLVALEGKQALEQPLATETFKVNYDRQVEARQIIMDAWRFQRDFFYDPGLHGINWLQERDKYLDWASYVTTDTDLSFVLREFVGELSAGHVWAVAAPRKRYTYNGTGLLGAEFSIDQNTFQITKIYDAGFRRTEHKSPLSASGVDVQEGEYLLAVNGHPLDIEQDIWAAFEGLAGQNVELTVNQRPTFLGARNIVVETLKSEAKLRELAWVEDNRAKVERLSDGRIGYIYVPDTSLNGQNELVRQYRAQFDKEGLVVDERFNSGGALGDRLVELLNRPPLVYFSARNGQAYPLPELSHYGPKALLINGWSYSGGDGFPLLFKAAGVGPLIGEPTWGGLIGPASSVPFVSGGRMAAPPQRVYNTSGEWAEPNGVQPDIHVSNDPGQLAAGIDQQLIVAVANVFERLDDFPAHHQPPYPSETTK